MPEIKPESQPQVTARSRSFFPKIENKTVLMIGIFALLVIAVVFSLLRNWPLSLKREAPKDVNEPPIVDPQSPSAFKYYPGGANSSGLSGPDFRDGSNAALVVKMQKSADKVILSWDPAVKVLAVEVWDLGRLYDLTDHKKIWQISNYDPKNPPTAQTGKEPSLNSPYELGQIPSGFFNTDSTNLKLVKGSRYSCELRALTEKGLPTLGTYTFTY